MTGIRQRFFQRKGRPTRRPRWTEPVLERVLIPLSELAAGGLPLFEVLEATERHLPPSFRPTFRDARAAVERGARLSDAFRTIGWPPYALAALALAEMTGDVAAQLAHLRDHYARRVRFRRTIRARLAYPAFLLALALLLFGYLLAGLGPRLQALETALAGSAAAQTVDGPLGSDAPWTAGLIGGLAVAGLIGGGAAGVGLAVRRGSEAAVGRLVRLGPLGRLVRLVLTREAIEPLGLLLQAGHDVLAAVRLLQAETPWRVLRAWYGRLEARLLAGATLTGAFEETPWLEDDWRLYVESGERSGRLVELLNAYAARLEAELERRTEAAVRWIEPAAVLVVGGAVLLVAGTLFGMVFDLMARL
ncbi:type II secretion system F family protein [Hydrogenibacillus schlegelii]|uniref:General secretion pathway protein F n=1 Tax=Hydrogenibacillus schlegelii TaxID=1484 RepID=A0A2T5G6M8_HYDSH|nr:type II secretion system F family protein [Hydrogenibacillus schlegelii]PTQ51847.1 MAG: General secretion pathway protein F [Hydrogenibacillus schlegelii]